MIHPVNSKGEKGRRGKGEAGGRRLRTLEKSREPRALDYPPLTNVGCMISRVSVGFEVTPPKPILGICIIPYAQRSFFLIEGEHNRVQIEHPLFGQPSHDYVHIEAWPPIVKAS